MHYLRIPLIFLLILPLLTVSAFEPIQIKFGTDHDGDGGLLLQAVDDDGFAVEEAWIVTNDSLRYELWNDLYTTAGALLELSQFTPSENEGFVMTVTGRRSIDDFLWTRVGLVALANNLVGKNEDDSAGFFAIIHRPHIPVRELRIATGLQSSSRGSKQLGEVQIIDFKITMVGTYDSSGQLVFSSKLETSGRSWEVEADRTFRQPRDHRHFGIAGRFRGPVQFDFQELTIAPLKK